MPERVFLVTQAEIDKIDALVSALNLARAVRGPRADSSTAQGDYDKQIAEIIYRDDLRASVVVLRRHRVVAPNRRFSSRMTGMRFSITMIQ